MITQARVHCLLKPLTVDWDQTTSKANPKSVNILDRVRSGYDTQKKKTSFYLILQKAVGERLGENLRLQISNQIVDIET